MTRDFASNNRKSSRKSGAAKRKKSGESKPGLWFGSGFLGGILFCVLVFLALQQPANSPTAGGTGNESESGADNNFTFQFWDMLPQQSIDLDLNEEDIAAANRPRSKDLLLLQAGSFRQREDANQRRGQILLLGLEVEIQEINNDTGRWFRVYIGPFDTRSSFQRARNLTAQEGIDTLTLKRPGQG